ncbi:MAG: CoA-binding protein [Thermofilum sp.]
MEKLASFFNPRGVAVVGASREPEKPGHVILRMLLENRQRGVLRADVYPVNPNADSILGVRCYKSVRELPDSVDLAIIVVPAKFVPEVVLELGAKGIRSAVVITAGFSEVGNVELERELLEAARKAGVRIIGPNCIGIFSPWSGLDTLFIPSTKELKDGRVLESAPRPARGYVALISQSGAVGTAALDYMAGEGIGLSHFFSIGNKVDVDEVELLEALRADHSTRVILLYLENVRRGREFVKVASEVTKEKPVVALKAGRTAAGRRAAASHTAALAGVDEVYNAAFERCGIVRAADLEELFDFAKALLYQPPPRGPRVGILTDGGGAGVMATDMAEMLGLTVPELRGWAREELEALQREGVIPGYAPIANPVDLTGSATDEMFTAALTVLLSSDEIDSVLVLSLHQVPGIPDPVELARKVAEISRRFDKPVLAVDTGWSDAAVLMRREYDRLGIPAYPTPERAVKALNALWRFGSYLLRKGSYSSYMKSYLEFREKFVTQKP